MITLALAKGRLQEATLARLAAAGISVGSDQLDSRRLVLEDAAGEYRFLLVKPSDVPIYVEHGVAQAGVCGRDVLLEHEPDVYEPLDLAFGFCRLAVAGRPEAAWPAANRLSKLRVATKYPRVTQKHFQRRATPVDIIPLTGSVELAPVLGLADCIVDIVETGRTLAENGLAILEVIAPISARCIVNRAAFHLERARLTRLLERLAPLTISPG
ncbi:MAG: ATP phosphoribosyltransferase [Chloracidobacterium sp.]|nr:ATP phosphoribosyltransferase [Chloracidobacterium sp.]MDW8218339.1 ATP phosphoribosyltransferase [Acidobacteriota bacterium]